MDRALAQLRAHGATINDEDRRVSHRWAPITSTFLGCYHFSLPEAIARGEFRPLRDPTESTAKT